jgi:hypothetical protein
MNCIKLNILIFSVGLVASIFFAGCSSGRLNQENIRQKQSPGDEHYEKKQPKNIHGFSKPSLYLLPKKIREKQPYILIQEQNKQLDQQRER